MLVKKGNRLAKRKRVNKGASGRVKQVNKWTGCLWERIIDYQKENEWTSLELIHSLSKCKDCS